jgi:S-sulfo-L-cysteine synthase (O-acetyl-L-serine-dependent)
MRWVVIGAYDNFEPELVELQKLRSHERINKEYYIKLLEEIKQNRVVKPIIVDSKSYVILDGHHRAAILKALGYSTIPAFLIDYMSKKIKVYPGRDNYPVDKKLVVEKGLSGKLFPPKTTRHVIKGLKNYNIPLSVLEINYLDKTLNNIALDATGNSENKTILEVIGNTPIVRINKLNKNKNVNIYAKLEGNNPGGSVKDRIALKMIEEAERNGQLTHDKTIIEPTSGNTGIGLAMVAAVKGYRIKVVMSESVSIERRKMLRAFGAEIILTDKEKGTDGAIIKAGEIAERNKDRYFMPNQFANKNNILTHYQTTGEEIIRQINGKIDIFIAGMGTTGTLIGTGTRLKEFNPKIKIIGVEPSLGHKIQGLKNLNEATIPKIYDPTLLDEKINVSDNDAYVTARRLAREEGIFVGMSSGAAMFAAIKVAAKMKRGNIVVIFPDRGEKYLSTELYDQLYDQLDSNALIAEKTI